MGEKSAAASSQAEDDGLLPSDLSNSRRLESSAVMSRRCFQFWWKRFFMRVLASWPTMTKGISQSRWEGHEMSGENIT